MMEICGKHRGVVVNNVDPQQMGRLQVQVPSVAGTDALFALPSVPYAGPGVGFFFLPPVGANVWVEFEEGDKNRPIWSGGFWGSGELPPEANLRKKVLKTEGATLTIEDLPGGGGLLLEVGQTKMKLSLKNGIIEIDNSAGASIKLAGLQVSINNGGLDVI
ncbi:MAG: phage baseplate assembly protein V [candidate division Zixibacteria bacterium]|nr:phage baseplate assembly protein V [candidate division Zixibacteria bacterium]